MNALYAARDGSLFDPVGGLADLAARRVRFIGEAERRIREAEEPYKLEILEGIRERDPDAPITLYHMGGMPGTPQHRWWDLCAGPHVEHTGMLPKDAIALESIAGGNSHVVTLLFGILFPIVHSGLASLRPYAEPIVGARTWRVIFAWPSLCLAYSWIVYFIAHCHDGVVLWNGEANAVAHGDGAVVGSPDESDAALQKQQKQEEDEALPRQATVIPWWASSIISMAKCISIAWVFWSDRPPYSITMMPDRLSR